jgi:two-component system, NarL family, sensor kinase
LLYTKNSTMKFYLRLFILFYLVSSKAQTLPKKDIFQELRNCTNKECQIKISFLIAEQYLEEDDIFNSQKWLDITKNKTSLKKIDSTKVFIHSLQSELFYYNGLHQFGINEAEKAIAGAQYIKDSLLISNGYFFKGINLIELNKLNEAELFLWKSRDFQPVKFKKNHIRSSILNEHIYNNLAQVKLQLHQSDSAIWYNSRAYFYAKKCNSKRGIPNTEQTFSLIYLDDNKLDLALLYLNKSIQSAQKSNYYDIVLSNYGFMLNCYPNNQKEINLWFKKGIKLIKQKKINITYQAYFFKIAIKALKKYNQLESLNFAQEQLLHINERIALHNNDYIQSITKQYLKNENKLLKQELDLIKNQKEKQLYFIISLILIVLSFGIWYFFKQRQNIKNKEIITLQQQHEITTLEALMDGEEKERRRIAQELHDGLNSDLSAIKYRLSSLEESGLSAIDTENLTNVINMIDESCAQVRSISHNLMPASIIEYGLIETVKEYCIKINNSKSFQIDFQFFGNYRALSKKTETVIYRIIQELITNILKHSKATEALIQFNYREDELFITVEDNGIGFDKNAISQGIGHKNIKTRIDFLNAQLDFDSSPEGTSYTISIDLNQVK